MSANLASALLAAQKAAPVIPKDASSSAFGGRTKYVSLDSLLALILPVLHDAGLVLTQHPSHVDGQPALTTRIIHAETGEAEESTMLLMMAKADPQGQGSAITYARRYSLMAALGLSAGEDDDGHAASRRKEPVDETFESTDLATAPQWDRINEVAAELSKVLGSKRALTEYNKIRTGGALSAVNPDMLTQIEADAFIGLLNARVAEATSVPA